MVQAPPTRSKKEKSTKPKVQDHVTALFEKNGWTPFPFQKKAWSAYARGQSGLIHAPTGTGKTYAAWAGPLIEWMDEHAGKPMPKRAPELRVLWLTPLRALVKDTTHSLCSMIEELGLPWTVEERTGDTTGAIKAKQRKRFPSCLVTTPESLSLLLSYPETKHAFSNLRAVVVDEWHELLSTKRGVQTELGLGPLAQVESEAKNLGDCLPL